MDKKYNDIDDLFASTLGGEEVIVPASIKAGIDKAIAKKRGFAFWWLALIPVLFIGGYFLIPGETVDENSNLTGKQTNEIDLVDESLESNHDNFRVESTDKNAEINTANSQKNTQVHATSNLDNDFLNEPSDNRVQEGTAENTKSVGTSPSPETGGETASIDSPDRSTLSNETDEDRFSPSGNNPDGNSEKSTLDLTPKGESQPESSNLDLGNKVPTPVEMATSSNKTTTEDLSLMPFSKIEALKLKKHELVLPSDIIAPKQKIKRGFWMISATGGYLANKATLSNDFTSTSNDVTNTYSENNTSVFDFKGGYYFNRKIGVKTGLSTYQMSEDYAFSESEWQYSTDSTYVEDITYVYDDSTGMVIDTIDASYYNYSTDSNYVNLSNVSGTNTLRVVRIPIYFSYLFKYKRFMFEPELFGSINFILNQQGIIAPGTSLIEYNKANPVYQKRFFSAGLGLTVHYHLSEHFLLSGYGRYQKPFGNLYTGAYSKTISSFAVGGGLSFTF